MKKLILLILINHGAGNVQAQVAFDSITISRFLIGENMYGARWADTLKAGRYPVYLSGERTIWVKPAKTSKILPQVISLANRVKTNGTEDVSKCFIPRHSINYYKEGKITRYLLVCFECDGVRFSDDPLNSFVKSVGTREKQMAELKILFKELAD
ncbi:MAG: hypothetical protein H7Y01_16015 [Ferruginibacter sp.]|nr:hypothetical protein [Chitinophagaceae bacterium]